MRAADPSAAPLPSGGASAGAAKPDLGPAHLSVQGLSLRYAHAQPPALENLSFEIPEGEQVALIGPNGAGKSSLLKAMVGLLRPQAGTVKVHGLPFGHDRDCVAYVPQREEVDWRFPVSVMDVVLMGRYGRLGWLRRPGPADRAAASTALAALGLADLGARPIGDLSGGQQQRVFLARALAQEPHILLLDEPFTGVDAASQERVLELLARLREHRVTVIAATHDLELAAERFDRVLLLNRCLVAYGSAAEVFRPQALKAAYGSQAWLADGGVLVDHRISTAGLTAARHGPGGLG